MNVINLRQYMNSKSIFLCFFVRKFRNKMVNLMLNKLSAKDRHVLAVNVKKR